MRVAKVEFTSNLLALGGISINLIEQMLNFLPSDTKFIGCGTDVSKLTCYLVFMSENFPEISEGCFIPCMIAYFERNSDGTSKCTGLSTSFSESNSNLINNDCNHFWNLYKGLNENYEYCKICNIRRNS